MALVVDLDGTLVRGDTLWESFFRALLRSPADCLFLPSAALRSKAHLKRWLIGNDAERIAQQIPYRTELLEYIRKQRMLGRTVILATGADQRAAQAVASHLGIFDQSIGSDGTLNLTGLNKLEELRRILPGTNFVYVGDSRADIPIWKACRHAILVGPAVRFREDLEKNGVTIHWSIPIRGTSHQAVIRLIRPHQWAKNLLVFLPLLLAHRIYDAHALNSGILAFGGFSFLASAVYVVNDALDVPTDRQHPVKRHRPLADGSVPLSWVPGLVLFLLLAASVSFATLPSACWVLACLYLLCNFVYTVWLKERLALDIVCLAAFYTVRVALGATAGGIRLSVWTFAFCALVFTSLALSKRLSELRINPQKERRGYLSQDLPILAALTAASGYAAILVLLVYLASEDVRQLYSRPDLLWLACGPLLYWTTRFSILANRGQLGSDPVSFAVKDRATWLVMFAVITCGWMAS